MNNEKKIAITCEDNVTFKTMQPDINLPSVAPWRRYFARTLDMLPLAILSGVFLEIYSPSTLESPHTYIDDLIFGLAIIPIWLLLEPIFLSFFGTTLGKWFLNIRIKNSENKKITYLMALKRTFLVSFRGLGLGIPVISFITCIVAYINLTTQGTTSWDRDCHFIVTPGNFGITRTITIILLIALFGFVIVLGTII